MSLVKSFNGKVYKLGIFGILVEDQYFFVGGRNLAVAGFLGNFATAQIFLVL
jgi:hypothetical protein